MRRAPSTTGMTIRACVRSSLNVTRGGPTSADGKPCAR